MCVFPAVYDPVHKSKTPIRIQSLSEVTASATGCVSVCAIRANRFMKMVLFRRVASGKLGRIFTLGLMLLVATRVSRVSGQGTLPLYISI